MKKIIILLILISVFVISIIAGNYCVKKYDSINQQENLNEEQEEKTNIIERNELNSRGLFELSDGTSAPEINLMSNDMKWDDDTRLYYKIINNIDDYNKYKERISLPELKENDFEEKFIVIIANENNRSEEESDLMIYNVISDDTTTQIIMKQKENPSAYSINNVFYAVVENVDLKENIDVKIDI